MGITSVALSALVTQPDSAVQLIKRHTPIRPCQHHSHPQKETSICMHVTTEAAQRDTLECLLRIFLKIRIRLRMRNENSLPRARTIGPSGAESRVHTPATYRHYCRHYQIGHLHAPPWFRTRSPSPPPPCLFSHNIRSIIGDPLLLG